ncbi:MAG: hypothetical protein WD355_01360 [Balneolaceae bacterium]
MKNKQRFLYLLWLLPVYFAGMSAYQVAVYKGITETFQEGEEYSASVTDFDVKQIAAQTSGYVDLLFRTDAEETIEQRLSLSVQTAQVVMEYESIPVMYKPESFRQIVIIPSYELQKKMIRYNLAILGFGLIVTILIAIGATRYANRRIREGAKPWVIERLDRAEDEAG